MLGLPDEYKEAPSGNEADSGRDVAVQPDASDDSSAQLDGAPDGALDGTGGGSPEAGADAAEDTAEDAPADATADSASDGPQDAQADAPTDGDASTQPAIIELSAAMDHACVLVQSGGKGSVYCWGQCSGNRLGQACPGSETVVNEPLQVMTDGVGTALDDATSIAASDGTTCALRKDSTVLCWGMCGNGTSGNSACTGGYTEFPVRVETAPGQALQGIARIAGGGSQLCAWTAAGELYCWGVDPSNQGVARATATRVFNPFGAALKALASVWDHSCLLDDTTVKCWGDDEQGQSSGFPGNPSIASTPVSVPIGGAAAGVSTAYSGSCAVRQDGRVVCWGSWNDDYQLTQPALVKIGSQDLQSMKTVSGSYWAYCGLDSSGSPWCWGKAPRFLLGPQYATTDYAEPVQIAKEAGGALSGMTLLDSGGSYACATDGTDVWCWGDLGYLETVYSCYPEDAGPTSECALGARKVFSVPFPP